MADPIGAAIGGASVAAPWMPLATAAIGAAGSALRGAPAGPSAVYSDPFTNLTLGLTTDFSGWTVATGGSQATAENTKGADAITPSWLKAGALILAAVVAVRWINKKH